MNTGTTNMSIEEFIKNETDKKFNDFKEKAKEKGLVLGKLDELYFRAGVSYGISIAGLSLVNIDTSKLI